MFRYAGPSPIMLHQDGEYVSIDDCPWHGVDYSQERWIVNLYGHYKNGHLVLPIADWPAWLSEGVAVLTHCDNVEAENRQNRSKS